MDSSASDITIDLSALGRNADRIEERAGGAKVMAVVKSDAYGHGAGLIAGALEERVDWFGVNDVHEGVALREQGISRPILVFGVPEQRHRKRYSEWRLTASVSSLSHFSRLDEGTEYHLLFDTGMGRLGLLPAEAAEAGELIGRSPANCMGCYSHFATADDAASGKPEEQLQVFRSIRETIGRELPAHIANTGGLFNVPQSTLDMIRIGIGFYGYAPGTGVSLQPVLQWKTHLVQVRRLRKGQSVSYGARWQCPADGYIGTIPVGYRDGIPRSLSGKLEVEAGGNRFPVAGTVTMNYCMVWLGTDRLPEGTEISLLSATNSAAEWAEKAETIPYEILTGLSPSIPRRTSGGKI